MHQHQGRRWRELMCWAVALHSTSLLCTRQLPLTLDTPAAPPHLHHCLLLLRQPFCAARLARPAAGEEGYVALAQPVALLGVDPTEKRFAPQIAAVDAGRPRLVGCRRSSPCSSRLQSMFMACQGERMLRGWFNGARQPARLWKQTLGHTLFAQNSTHRCLRSCKLLLEPCSLFFGCTQPGNDVLADARLARLGAWLRRPLAPGGERHRAPAQPAAPAGCATRSGGIVTWCAQRIHGGAGRLESGGRQRGVCGRVKHLCREQALQPMPNCPARRPGIAAGPCSCCRRRHGSSHGLVIPVPCLRLLLRAWSSSALLQISASYLKSTPCNPVESQGARGAGRG